MRGIKNKTSNERGSRRIPNSSQINQVVQPKKVPKSKKNGNPVEYMSGEASRFKNKEVPFVCFK